MRSVKKKSEATSASKRSKRTAKTNKQKSQKDAASDQDNLEIVALEPRIMLDAAGTATFHEGLADTAIDVDLNGDARSLQEALTEKVADLDLALATITNQQEETQAEDNRRNSVLRVSADTIDDSILLPSLGNSEENFQNLSFTGTTTGGAIQQVESGDVISSVDGEVFSEALSQASFSTVVAPELLDVQPTSDNDIFVIDKTIVGYESLLESLPENANIIFIEPGENGLETILDGLSGQSEISALHIFAHGDAGILSLGDVVLTNETIQGEYAAELAMLGSFLSESGDLLIYGCNFAEGETGQLAVEQLALITGADIAASDDLTGNAALGGDWILESTTGAIEAKQVNAVSFDGLLLLEPSDITVPVDDPATTGVDERAEQVANTIFGPGVTVNTASISGGDEQVALFSGAQDPSTDGFLNFDEGVISVSYTHLTLPTKA